MFDNMKTYNYIVCVITVLCGGMIVAGASAFPATFTENGPGPGFWPMCLGCLMLLAAAILLAYTCWRKSELEACSVKLTGKANRRVYLMMLMAVLFCVLFQVIGFYAAALIFIPSIMLLMDYHDVRIMAATTVGTVLFIYVVFGILLHTKMPQSVFL
ncbi:MAG: tripartite tricarboxylate transporter TctB family protein [Acidaminococcaceae bacterium]|nr:tripartite tricarboxylate transporter TctB family protein [Acidaminococcaceae bacterium]